VSKRTRHRRHRLPSAFKTSLVLAAVVFLVVAVALATPEGAA